jgi:hypothetical protein
MILYIGGPRELKLNRSMHSCCFRQSPTAGLVAGGASISFLDEVVYNSFSDVFERMDRRPNAVR